MPALFTLLLSIFAYYNKNTRGLMKKMLKAKTKLGIIEIYEIILTVNKSGSGLSCHDNHTYYSGTLESFKNCDDMSCKLGPI